MPEAAMYLNHGIPPGKDYVRPPRQPPIMQDEPEALDMQGSAQAKLGGGVLTAYACHHPGTGLLVHYIGHAVTALARRTWYVSNVAQFPRSRICLPPMA